MPPVMGSQSLNATRNGLSHPASRSQAARLAGAAGSPGEALTPEGGVFRRFRDGFRYR